MKAYEEMTGKKISEKSKDAATDELITTGEVAENIGSDDAEKLIADVKQKVAEDNLSSPSEIKQAIEESANDLNISLSDADKEKIQNLMGKISDLDLNVSQLKEQAKDLYDKLNNSGILEKIAAFFRSVVNGLEICLETKLKELPSLHNIRLCREGFFFRDKMKYILYYGSWMHGLSDDRNCEKTCIFVGAFGSRSILFVDRIWYLYFLSKKKELQLLSI